MEQAIPFTSFLIHQLIAELLVFTSLFVLPCLTTLYLFNDWFSNFSIFGFNSLPELKFLEKLDIQLTTVLIMYIKSVGYQWYSIWELLFGNLATVHLFNVLILQYAGTVMTSNDYVISPTRGCWFQTLDLNKLCLTHVMMQTHAGPTLYHCQCTPHWVCLLLWRTHVQSQMQLCA